MTARRARPFCPTATPYIRRRLQPTATTDARSPRPLSQLLMPLAWLFASFPYIRRYLATLLPQAFIAYILIYLAPHTHQHSAPFIYLFSCSNTFFHCTHLSHCIVPSTKFLPTMSPIPPTTSLFPFFKHASIALGLYLCLCSLLIRSASFALAACLFAPHGDA